MPYKDGWDLGKFAGLIWCLIKIGLFLFLAYFFCDTIHKIYETNRVVKEIQETLKDKNK